jgi:uncharacterized iron-regulated membrane protein
MPAATDTAARSALHQWLWRWHGYAGLFVAPFIFFMALTGLPYVWEHELEDLWHPEYRALTPQPAHVSYQQQLATAKTVYPDKPLLLVVFDGNPRHATQFQFGSAVNPFSVYINPYTGEVITRMSEWTRLSSACIMLHGLTFIEPYGSWLLELLACWGIVLCLTGVFLWWPRDKSKIMGVLMPRWRSTGRARWRDLHAVTGFYFAAALVLYLGTGLPWTAFWGGRLLALVQTAAGENFPANMTAGSGLESVKPSAAAEPLPLDAFVEFGLRQNLPGLVEIQMPTETDGTVYLRNRLHHDQLEKHFQLDLYTASPLGTATWDDLPLTHKAVALGINLHEGALFGRVTQVLSTVLACAFMFIAAAGAVMWWKRRPNGRLDVPVIVPTPALPPVVKAAIVILGLVMPLLGLSFLLFAFCAPAAQGRRPRYRRR